MSEGAGTSESQINRNRWIRTDVILLVLAAAVFVWLTSDVLLLVFAGILLAVGLDGLACGLARHSPLSRGSSMLVTLVLILAFVFLVGRLVIPQFLEQLDEMWRQLVEFVEARAEQLQEYGWAEQVVGGDNGEGQMADAAGAAAEQAARATMAVFGAIASLIILVPLTLFVAGNPELYRQGALQLLPPGTRERVDTTLSSIAYALRWWFLGQLVSMALLGITVSAGLFLLGIELWLGLGVLTALLTFIPFLGPLIAAVPIAIVGFTEGMQTGLIVLAFYLAVQNIEGNFIVPMIQHKAVNLAPALFIAIQVLMGILFGAVGLILAAPLTVVGMVAVQKLWIEYTLGETTSAL